MLSVSIIIPVLNEEDTIRHTLEQLKKIINDNCEIIIVDGGSNDQTLTIAAQYTNHCYTVEKGRATQMNHGATHANNDVLLFLHADTLLPVNFYNQLNSALQSSKHQWGRFNIRLSGLSPLLRMIEWFMNVRSRMTSIATGDQAIFVQKSLFKLVGGFKKIPLMEDIELSKSLRKHSKPVCLKTQVVSSSRRWEDNGYLKTITLMWKLRLLYFFGVSADKLVKLYY